MVRPASFRTASKANSWLVTNAERTDEERNTFGIDSDKPNGGCNPA